MPFTRRCFALLAVLAGCEQPVLSEELEDTAFVPFEEIEDTPIDDTAPPPAAEYGINLLENPGLETGDLTGWDVTQRGGDGLQVMQAQLAHTGGFYLRTSYQFSSRSQRVDLLEAGYTVEELDAEPLVHAAEWFAERCETGDRYWFRVTLLDAEGSVIDQQTLGGRTTASTSLCSYADDEWFELTMSFSDYGPGLRAVLFEDGGQDSEWWAGYFGIQMDDAWLSLSPPQ
ncbi:MAG: hypothetical protein EP330_07415 [Deltaproteobacteria bacterium]|nr:MAG: hypothetical protein EP330_07415 [Deltaproteobacteria bacterium]